jgi:lipopolysaccharide biosynthesis glycosyltransferase
MLKKAIATIAVGEEYQRLFNEFCRNSWQTYCDAFGYDLILIGQSMDNSARAANRSPAWQKLLVLSQDWSGEYDRIVWVDSDIIMNNSYSYDICDGVPPEKVGAVDEFSIPTREIHDLATARLYRYWKEHNIPYIDNMTPAQYYVNRGISGADLTNVVQTGVLVCSPKHHRKIFEYVYEHYEDRHGAEWNYEMPALSFELLKAGAVAWISSRFNFVVPHIIAAFYPDMLLGGGNARKITRIFARKKFEMTHLKSIYDLSIFMHFAGSKDLIAETSRIIQSMIAKSIPVDIG